jgi:cyclophilin family peptidyl-prolyl cis-trans isomerase
MNTLAPRPLRGLLAALILSALSFNALGAPVNVTLETSLGTIQLELDADKAPASVANFVQYAKDGHYDGLVFHRVIKGFMIQGGGYDESFSQRKTRAPIQNEAANGLKNRRGTVAMARTGQPHSATSQFFINHADNGFLDHPGQDGWGYAVFGKVTAGMDVVDKIADTPTGSAPPFGRDVPTQAVVIKKVTVAEPAKP